MEENPGESPRSLGDPLILNGSNSIPPVNTNSTGTAYFWLQACNCSLVYNIVLNLAPNTFETGCNIYGAANASSVAGLVFSLPIGLVKEGIWNFCNQGIDPQLILDGKFYVVVHLTTGDIRTQILWSAANGGP